MFFIDKVVLLMKGWSIKNEFKKLYNFIQYGIF